MSLSVFSSCDVGTGTSSLPPDPPALAKWNPGNYIATPAQITSGMWNTIKTRLGDTAEWKGALIRYDWTMLERALGEYGWSESGVNKGFDDIDQKLDEIAAFPGRRLVILVYMKSFGASSNSVPAYMRNSSTYSDGENYYITRDGVATQGSFNGQYAYESSNGGPGGFVPNMHVAAVKARFDALMAEFASRYNNTDRGEYLEAVIFNEASISSPAGAVGATNETLTGGVVVTRPNTDGGSWHSQDDWYNNMADSYATAKTLLTRTIIGQWVNGPRSVMETWVPTITGHGVGIGMTDTCSNDKGFWRNRTDTNASAPGNIYHCRTHMGEVPIMCHISGPAIQGSVADRNQNSESSANYEAYATYTGRSTFPDFDNDINTVHGGSPYQTKAFIRDFAVDYLGATHLFWLHQTVADRDGSGNTVAEATDAWISNPASDITTVTTRPIGW